MTAHRPRAKREAGLPGTAAGPSNALAFATLSCGTLFGIAYGYSIVRATGAAPVGELALALLLFKTGVEIAAGFYVFALVFTSVTYLLMKRSALPRKDSTECPPVGVVYLCCEDLDPEALYSLARLRYRGPLYFVVHDDSSSAEARARVDTAVDELARRSGRQVLLLRRPDRTGGKPGALNYLLRETGHLYRYFLLCDSDSTLLDPQTAERALPYFQDERVAVVQLRSVAADNPSYCPLNRLLARSIDIYHLFLTASSRLGWQPFIGHNALLRTDRVLQAGGFTPGFFSDDLDLTVRLNLLGHRVAYAPEIRMGEKHPQSYAAFRKRSYKWAYGCVQVLREHARSVLTTRSLSFAEKWSFFQLVGFYAGQTVLLLYLALTLAVAPFFLELHPLSVGASVVAGSVLVLVIYLPAVSYFLKEGPSRSWVGSVIACGLVYGTTDFACARGVWDALRNRRVEWTPTNGLEPGRSGAMVFGEALFGSLLLFIPLLASPALLYFPCVYLFAGKFLFGPSLWVLYDDTR